MAANFREAGMEWEKVRAAIQPLVEERVGEWVNPAQLNMLLAFGKGEAWRQPANHFLGAAG